MKTRLPLWLWPDLPLKIQQNPSPAGFGKTKSGTDRTALLESVVFELAVYVHAAYFCSHCDDLSQQLKEALTSLEPARQVCSLNVITTNTSLIERPFFMVHCIVTFM